MDTVENRQAGRQLFYRIVALWAVCEGTLGGIIHGFNLPGTGLIVSSASVICISLIAWHYPKKGMILKATIIVAIFKMILSPHTPPTAYIAVFFQGCMGELLFHQRNRFKRNCLLLAITALVESSIQRLLVLTLIYGTEFWKAVNIFLSRLTGQDATVAFSWYIAAGYVLLHFIAGVYVGKFAGTLPEITSDAGGTAISLQGEEEIVSRKKKRRKAAVLLLWIALALLYIQSAFHIGEPLLPASMPLQILIRSILILFTWYFVAAPLIGVLLKRWLKREQHRLKEEVDAVVTFIPGTRRLLIASWRDSEGASGFDRLRRFAVLALTRTLN